MSTTPVYLLLDIAIIFFAMLLWLPLMKRLDKLNRTAAWATVITLCVMASAFQYLCLVRVGAWNVHAENTWLLPIKLLGSPIEEYLFWWGFAFIMTAAYLWPRYLFTKSNKGNV